MFLESQPSLHLIGSFAPPIGNRPFDFVDLAAGIAIHAPLLSSRGHHGLPPSPPVRSPGSFEIFVKLRNPFRKDPFIPLHSPPPPTVDRVTNVFFEQRARSFVINFFPREQGSFGRSPSRMSIERALLRGSSAYLVPPFQEVLSPLWGVLFLCWMLLHREHVVVAPLSLPRVSTRYISPPTHV